MPKEKLRLGMIGTGGIAWGHMSALQKIDDVDIAAACDINRAAVMAAAEKRNPGLSEEPGLALCRRPERTQHEPLVVWIAGAHEEPEIPVLGAH